MTVQKRPGKYPAEMRDRAVRMVFEAEQHCDSQWEAIVSVAEKLGPTAETVRKWVRRVEIDEGRSTMDVAGSTTNVETPATSTPERYEPSGTGCRHPPRCLKHRTPYNAHTAWAHRHHAAA